MRVSLVRWFYKSKYTLSVADLNKIRCVVPANTTDHYVASLSM